jgi:hypothetical protein
MAANSGDFVARVLTAIPHKNALIQIKVTSNHPP